MDLMICNKFKNIELFFIAEILLEKNLYFPQEQLTGV